MDFAQEVLLHGGTPISGWRTSQIHAALLTAYALAPQAYTLNQLRYDLRKMKSHGLLQRDGHRCLYRLTEKGIRVALLFIVFHKRVCGPLANSLFHYRPDPQFQPSGQLEAAYHRADQSIQEIIELLAA